MSEQKVIVTDDIFAILKSNGDDKSLTAQMAAFDAAFGVEAGTVRAQFQLRMAREAEEERLKSLRQDWKEIEERFEAFVAPKSLQGLILSASDKAAELSSGGREVTPCFSVSIVNGEVKVGVSAKGLSKPSRGKSRGPKVRYDYFHQGTKIDGFLKRYILENCGESAAAQAIRDFDLGNKKGNISAWDAVMGDEALAPQFKRRPRAETTT